MSDIEMKGSSVSQTKPMFSWHISVLRQLINLTDITFHITINTYLSIFIVFNSMAQNQMQ